MPSRSSRAEEEADIRAIERAIGKTPAARHAAGLRLPRPGLCPARDSAGHEAGRDAGAPFASAAAARRTPGGRWSSRGAHRASAAGPASFSQDPQPVNSRAGAEGLADAVEAPGPPSRDVLFSQERLEAHARAIAAGHVLAEAGARSRPLLPRLDESAHELEDAYQFLSAIARADPQPVASEDWLRDNYHVVQDQVREVRQDLPRRVLLRAAEAGGRARAPATRASTPIARELIAHTAGRLDLETLVDFVSAYQRAAPLSIGETWAIPIMLRLALVEELRAWSTASSPRGAAASRRAAGKRRSPSERRDLDAEISIALLRERGATPNGRLLGGVRRRAAAVAARPAAVGGAGVAGAAARARSAGRLARRTAARRAPARSDRPARHRQRHHAACGCCRRSTGRCSSIASAWSNRSCAAIRPAPTREMDFPTRDRYRHSVEQLAKRSHAARARRGASGRSRWRATAQAARSAQRPAPPRRLLPDLARPIHPRERPALPAARARAAGALRLQASGDRLSRARSR